jgi:hypothetical protein
LNSDLLLEVGELLADGGLRYVKASGSAAEAALFCGGNEIAKVS